MRLQSNENKNDYYVFEVQVTQPSKGDKGIANVLNNLVHAAYTRYMTPFDPQKIAYTGVYACQSYYPRYTGLVRVSVLGNRRPNENPLNPAEFQFEPKAILATTPQIILPSLINDKDKIGVSGNGDVKIHLRTIRNPEARLPLLHSLAAAVSAALLEAREQTESLNPEKEEIKRYYDLNYVSLGLMRRIVTENQGDYILARIIDDGWGGDLL